MRTMLTIDRTKKTNGRHNTHLGNIIQVDIFILKCEDSIKKAIGFDVPL